MEGPEFILLLEQEWPSLLFEENQVKNVVSLFMSTNEVKAENNNDVNNPLKKFVAFVDYYSDFHRLIRSLYYVFRVIKSCLIKNVNERNKFFKLSISPLTV